MNPAPGRKPSNYMGITVGSAIFSTNQVTSGEQQQKMFTLLSFFVLFIFVTCHALLRI